ncbi:MipA/OmpV family protein [Rhodobacterales bacterium HKCCSP123]|nr:MipA/OmpV family protein [Rhodobacterales bacterium HKCCSP123]
MVETRVLRVMLVGDQRPAISPPTVSTAEGYCHWLRIMLGQDAWAFAAPHKAQRLSPRSDMKPVLLTTALALAPMIAAADSGISLSFAAGVGGTVAPEYFGSDSYGAGVTGGFDFGHLRIGGIEIGDPDPDAVAMGLRPRGSFRLIGARNTADYPELAGLDDIDLSVELGGGLSYRTDGFLAFADVRYGVIGHESWVAELGADFIFRPGPDWTVTAGPRALWGSERYTSTYFGVTSAEAANSAFTEYAAGDGFVSAGLEIGATYQISPDWSLDSTLAWERLTGDAAASPIVQEDDGVTFSLVLLRRFTFGY